MDQEADEQAMAAMMGFSSFGAQDRPQKKRRYNANADATIAGHPAKSHPPAPASKRKTTGSNSTPLGARPAATEAVGGNAEEIDLDEGDEHDKDDAGGASLDGATAALAGEADAAIQLSSGQTTAADSSPIHGLPQRPALPTDSAEPPPSGRGQPATSHQRDQHSAARTGSPWYEGYYDTLSNRNPWDKLERAMGLTARGTWLSHEEQQALAAV